MTRTRLPPCVLLALAGALWCAPLAAQDRESLFGAEARELTHVVGASRSTRDLLRRAHQLESEGEHREALAIYESILDSDAQDRDNLVGVPTGGLRTSPPASCFRRATDVAIERVLSLSPGLRREHVERKSPRARTLWRFWKATGDERALASLVEGYLHHPEGARAVIELVDRALEAGRPALALAHLERWIASSNRSGGEASFAARDIEARRAVAAAVLDGSASAPGPVPDPGDVAILTGGTGSDLPAAILPAQLFAGLSDAAAGAGPPVEIVLGPPLFSGRNPAQFNAQYSGPGGFSRGRALDTNHPLHGALPLVEPVRVGNLLVLVTPLTLQVLDLAQGGKRQLFWFPERDRKVRRFSSGHPRIFGNRGRGLWEALQNSTDSFLTRFPVARLHEQWVRLAPAVEVELGADGLPRVVAYVVMSEEGVIRGFSHAGVFAKVEIAKATERGGLLQPHRQVKFDWVARTGPYLPSGRPLVRATEGRVCLGMVREPSADESSLEVVVADFDIATGALASVTPVSTPPTNRAWQQDKEVISHVHPVSVATAPDGSIHVIDNRGTIACVDLSWVVAAPADEEAAQPAARIRWAVTYPSLHVEADSYDSGLRGWAASAPVVTPDGVLVAAPSDSDELLCIGPDSWLGNGEDGFAGIADLELPLVRFPRDDGRFLLGVSEGALVVQGRVMRSIDLLDGTGWEAAPLADDGIVLRRGARAQGYLLDPSRRAIRILEASTGRIAGILHLPRTGVEDLRGALLGAAERMGVSLLGDLLVIATEHGIAAWRLE